MKPLGFLSCIFLENSAKDIAGKSPDKEHASTHFRRTSATQNHPAHSTGERQTLKGKNSGQKVSGKA